MKPVEKIYNPLTFKEFTITSETGSLHTIFEICDIWKNESVKQLKTSGVYGLLNKITGKWYVGSAKNLIFRWKYGHLKSLRNSTHSNSKLQRSWNKYGEQSFKFCVLNFLCLSKDRKEETIWISNLNSFHNGYNQTPAANAVSDSMRFDTSKRMIEKHKQNPSMVLQLIERNKSEKQRNISRETINTLWTPEFRNEFWTAEQRKAQSEVMKSVNNMLTSEVRSNSWTPERRKKHSEFMKKRQAQLNKDHEFVKKRRAILVERNKSQKQRDFVKNFRRTIMKDQ